MQYYFKIQISLDYGELKNHKIQFRNGLKCKTWLLFISITDEIISSDQKLVNLVSSVSIPR